MLLFMHHKPFFIFLTEVFPFLLPTLSVDMTTATVAVCTVCMWVARSISAYCVFPNNRRGSRYFKVREPLGDIFKDLGVRFNFFGREKERRESRVECIRALCRLTCCTGDPLSERVGKKVGEIAQKGLTFAVFDCTQRS